MSTFTNIHQQSTCWTASRKYRAGTVLAHPSAIGVEDDGHVRGVCLFAFPLAQVYPYVSRACPHTHTQSERERERTIRHAKIEHALSVSSTVLLTVCTSGALEQVGR